MRAPPSKPRSRGIILNYPLQKKPELLKPKFFLPQIADVGFFFGFGTGTRLDWLDVKMRFLWCLWNIDLAEASNPITTNVSLLPPMTGDRQQMAWAERLNNIVLAWVHFVVNLSKQLLILKLQSYWTPEIKSEDQTLMVSHRLGCINKKFIFN